MTACTMDETDRTLLVQFSTGTHIYFQYRTLWDAIRGNEAQPREGIFREFHTTFPEYVLIETPRLRPYFCCWLEKIRPYQI